MCSNNIKYLAIIISIILVFIAELSSYLMSDSRYSPNITGSADAFKIVAKSAPKFKGYTNDEVKAIKQLNAIKIFTMPDSILTDMPADLPYRHWNPDRINRSHNGQRKLLLTEVLFLTLHGDKSKNVVYVGAAPAIHTAWLAELFPEHKFDLWDPSKFNMPKDADMNRIHIYNQYFTDVVAEDYTKLKGDLLFISDIRSAAEGMPFDEFEKRVHIDNEWQKNWIKIIQPRMSMLKFRMPFDLADTDKYQYLKGDIYLQPWAPIRSAETRLWIDEKQQTTDYDWKSYENQMYYFNNIIREFGKFRIPEKIKNKVPYIKDSYDTAYEIYIWDLYYQSLGSTDIDKIIYAMNHTTEVLKSSSNKSFHKK